MDLPYVNRHLSTQHVVYKLNKEKYIKCYKDSEFSGEWDQKYADNAKKVMSQTGYVITYAGFPVLWCSKLQT